MTLKLRLLSENAPIPLAREMEADCLAGLTTRCGYVDRRDKDPLAAAREMNGAVGAACAAAGGSYDAAADVARIAALFPGPLASDRMARLVSSDHACRVGERVSGMRVATYDYPPTPGSMSSLEALGIRHAPDRVVTAVYLFKAYEVAHHADERADVVAFKAKMKRQAQASECARQAELAIVEGAVTNAGLLVEKREKVALVQPAQGSAVWMPIWQLNWRSRPNVEEAERFRALCQWPCLSLGSAPDVRSRLCHIADGGDRSGPGDNRLARALRARPLRRQLARQLAPVP